MGCPEVPVQMSLVIYLANRLGKMGMDVVLAGTSSALNLARVSDPERHYLKKMVEIDRMIGDLVEGRREFDMCFAFAHNDAGVTYAATMNSISKARLYLVIFGKNAEALAQTAEFDCHRIVAKAVHNPMPLKKMLDEATVWDA
ncbi:MAG: DUF1890 domain-containing protein [Methanosarcinales archaeon]|nr:DUF1890 domain-containing protein [Methanosarcinales archaeon]